VILCPKFTESILVEIVALPWMCLQHVRCVTSHLNSSVQTAIILLMIQFTQIV